MLVPVWLDEGPSKSMPVTLPGLVSVKVYVVPAVRVTSPVVPSTVGPVGVNV